MTLVLASTILIGVFCAVGIKRQNLGWVVLPLVASFALFVSLMILELSVHDMMSRSGIEELAINPFEVWFTKDKNNTKSHTHTQMKGGGGTVHFVN